MDAWTWTIQMLSLNLKGLVPPCPELPRTVHLAPEESVFAATIRQRAEKRTS